MARMTSAKGRDKEGGRLGNAPRTDTMAGHTVKTYFVDEAGDPILFGEGGKIVVGRNGVSRFFMVGSVWLPDPALAHHELERLRRRLLAKPYFSGVPSMQPEMEKTALVFHAKDDPPEVRYEVINLLPSFGARVVVAIRRKELLAKQPRKAHKSQGRKSEQNAVYDELLTEVFRGRLRHADKNEVVVAHRDKKQRAGALKSALSKTGRGGRTCRTSTAYPKDVAGLQVVDYYLWAVQRMCERGEDRFFRELEAQYEAVLDADTGRTIPEIKKPFAG